MDATSVREALAAYDWQRAYELASKDDASLTIEEEAERLDALAEAAWWLGMFEECIAARERAYTLFEQAGRIRDAGGCALWLFEHHSHRARPAIGGAWLRRAHRALDDDHECVEYGLLLIRDAEAAHAAADLSTATAIGNDALELARRLGSPDLEALVLQAMGRILVDQGRPADGMAHFDEAMLLAVEGRLGPYATGKVYCSLISACEELGDPRRAAEWTEATARWSEQHPAAIFPGLCRVHWAVVLHQRGDAVEAEQAARRACEELMGSSLPNAAAAWTEVGEIRRRLGDLDGAEAAFATAEELCCQPRAGLALLRLAQGKADVATALITSALAGETWNRLSRAKLLPARVQIAVAVGDVDAARAASEELSAIAVEFASPALLAAAASARGRLALAEGDASGACAVLREAVQRWTDLDTPYEVATARVLLGRACREIGDDTSATASLVAAQAIFAKLGAHADARVARDLGQQHEYPAGLSGREVEVLRLVSSGLTNKQIAAELYLSEKTVARHVSNIFTKVSVNSRAAATRFAADNGIVGSDG